MFWFLFCFVLVKKKHDYRRPYAAASILHMQNYTTNKSKSQKLNSKVSVWFFMGKNINMNETETINWIVPIRKKYNRGIERERGREKERVLKWQNGKNVKTKIIINKSHANGEWVEPNVSV